MIKLQYFSKICLTDGFFFKTPIRNWINLYR